MMDEEFSFVLGFDDFDRKLIGDPIVGSDEFKSRLTQFFADQFSGFGGLARVIIDDGSRTIKVVWTKAKTWMDPKQKVIQLIQKGSNEEALPMLVALYHSSPTDTDVLFALGMTYHSLGQSNRAAIIFDHLLDLNPDDVATLISIGIAEMAEGNYLIAEEHLRKATKLDPNNLLGLKNLATTLIKQSRFEEAIPIVRKAIGISPKDITLLITMGDCLNDVGRGSESEAFYRMALKAGGPSHLIDEAKVRLTAKSEAVLHSESEIRMDVVEYMRSALRDFASMTTEQIQTVAVEIAVLGTKGLDINNKSKTYQVDSLSGDHSALKLVSIMYAAFKQFAPETDIGIDLSKEYRRALEE